MRKFISACPLGNRSHSSAITLAGSWSHLIGHKLSSAPGASDQIRPDADNDAIVTVETPESANLATEAVVDPPDSSEDSNLQSSNAVEGSSSDSSEAGDPSSPTMDTPAPVTDESGLAPWALALIATGLVGVVLVVLGVARNRLRRRAP